MSSKTFYDLTVAETSGNQADKEKARKAHYKSMKSQSSDKEIINSFLGKCSIFQGKKQ